VVRIVKKKLPTVFVCPRCGEESVRVTIAKDTGKATVMCALCQLKDEFQAHPAAQMIDVYSFFADRFYGVKDPRAIIPRQREGPFQPPAEEPSELEPPGAPAEAVEEPPGLQEPEASSETSKQTTDSQPSPATQGATEPSASALEGSSQEKAPETMAATENPETSVEEKPSMEEEEPFADILESKDKDKKRYSTTPLPQQQSEQSHASD